MIQYSQFFCLQGVNIQPEGFNIVPTGVNVQPQGASIGPNLIVIGPYDTTVAGQVRPQQPIPLQSPSSALSTMFSPVSIRRSSLCTCMH